MKGLGHLGHSVLRGLREDAMTIGAIKPTNEYIFYIAGLDKEYTVTHHTEKAASDMLWGNLTREEQKLVVAIECIDCLPTGYWKDIHKNITEYNRYPILTEVV